MMSQSYPSLLPHLVFLYGENRGTVIYEQLCRLIESWQARLPSPRAYSLSQSDSLLITYGDQVQQPGEPPLQTLTAFCKKHLTGLLGGVHILPFYPSSSDDGFSVIDYRIVDPALGSWEPIQHLGQSFRLMFDAVLNHASSQSAWFQAFLRDEAPYADYFHTVEGSPDLSQVVRPRTLPLLTQFNTTAGQKAVWTTFSADQIDLNYQNPALLLEMIDILLLYAARGASFIRLDAIAYLWKEIGTPCIHLPHTHRIVQLIRSVLDIAAPHVALITETNVPHQDNLSYFGDGHNEAQLIYNFTLPPLVLHTLRTGDARPLSAWAASLCLPSEHVTFFNFLASHDGIGLNPLRGILPQADIDALVNQTLAHGGHISYKNNPDGSQSPYEMNINYFDALSNPVEDEPLEVQINRFMVAQAIMLAMPGMPGIYFHSLFGSRGWPEGVMQLGHKRAINRQKLQLYDLERDLADPTSLRSRVFERFRTLLKIRRATAAFHPQAATRLLPNAGEGIFALLRSAPDYGPQMICLHNVTASPQPIFLEAMDVSYALSTPLQPYEVRWIAPEHLIS